MVQRRHGQVAVGRHGAVAVGRQRQAAVGRHGQVAVGDAVGRGLRRAHGGRPRVLGRLTREFAAC